MQIIEQAAGKSFNGRRQLKRLAVMLAVVAAAALAVYWRVQTKYGDRIASLENIPEKYDTAVVFGAGLKARGTPGAVLADRVLAGIQTYQSGQVSRLLMSGDNSQANHNEVQAMENLALAEGLPAAAIIHDHAGVNTYASCYRAKHELKLERAVLITQKYHLKRALYLCNELGLDAIGLDAARRDYPNQFQFSVREVPASIWAWLKIVGRKFGFQF